MQCPACGAYVTDEDEFCGECGHRLPERESGNSTLDAETARSQSTRQASPPVDTGMPGLSAPERKHFKWLTFAVAIGIGMCVLGLFVAGLVLFAGERETSTLLPAYGRVLFEDDFSMPGGWDTYASDETWADYMDGAYGLGVTIPDYVTWGNPDPDLELADFVVEVDARQVEGPVDNNFGILVRHQPDDENFYWFQISADGYYSVDLYRAGQWVTLEEWQTSDAILTGVGVTNHLSLVCSGEEFTFYANDTQLTTVRDRSFPSGNIGLAVGTFDDPGVVVTFDNVKVRAIEE